MLFLQGPASPFFDRIGREVVRRGHRALRINVCPGDALVWRLPGATAYRGRVSRWDAFVRRYYAEHGVTDVVLLGDARVRHRAAIEAAHALGVRVHAVELGYLRPDWLTIERDGMASFSHFPRDPDAIRALAAGRSAPDETPLARSTFLEYAVRDVAFNLANVIAGPWTYPFYRSHALYHPLVEYAGWLRKLAGEGRARRRAEATFARLAGAPGPLYLLPLQLRTDFQIRVHAPGGDLVALVERVVASFAAHAPAEARLLAKVHPLDNGLTDWAAILARAAEPLGVAARVAVVDGGDLDRMIARAAGVVTVNSTVGTASIRAGVPTIALGNAIYDVPGLAFQGPLDAFWREAPPPDADLADAFLRALAATIQVRGAFLTEEGMRVGAANVVERILREEDALPRTTPQDRGRVRFRRAAELGLA